MNTAAVTSTKGPLLGKEQTAIFAGGCFWCMESAFEEFPGVIRVISGYIGGEVIHPSYEQVSSGTTGHLESIQVIYDDAKVSYEELLEQFWRQIDPTDDGGSFVDRGGQYGSAIFYLTDEQKKIAEASKKYLSESGKFNRPIVTPIRQAGPFYPAEDYHQDYFIKHPLRYRYYRYASGRDQFIGKTWKDFSFAQDTKEEQYQKLSDEELHKKLTDLQYDVTQKAGTEPAFANEYWDTHEDGIYVDIVSGEPLFSSRDKYDSGTGWPSFVKPIDERFIRITTDRILLYERTEVKSRYAGSHLGHVFEDGPAERGGKRYCMNSAAMRFIPKDKLEAEGYGEWIDKI